MKMLCKSTPGAIPPSGHAQTEVEVSDQIYRINMTKKEAKSHCCEELIGRDLRIILGDNRHFRSPEYEAVTPIDVVYVQFYGVPTSNLVKT